MVKKDLIITYQEGSQIKSNRNEIYYRGRIQGMNFGNPPKGKMLPPLFLHSGSHKKDKRIPPVGLKCFRFGILSREAGTDHGFPSIPQAGRYHGRL